MKLTKILSVVVVSFFCNTSTIAQTDYPKKPIKLIVGFAPGGGSDFIARMIAVKIGKILGQSVVVDNKPGAGGNLAAEMALRSPADC